MKSQNLPGCSKSEQWLQHHATKKPIVITGPGPSNAGSSLIVSPLALKPLPKAPRRKSQRADRRKCKSAILTDTPEKTYLEDKKLEQEARKRKVTKRVLSEDKEVKNGNEKKNAKGKEAKRMLAIPKKSGFSAKNASYELTKLAHLGCHITFARTVIQSIQTDSLD